MYVIMINNNKCLDMAFRWYFCKNRWVSNQYSEPSHTYTTLKTKLLKYIGLIKDHSTGTDSCTIIIMNQKLLITLYLDTNVLYQGNIQNDSTMWGKWFDEDLELKTDRQNLSIASCVSLFLKTNKLKLFWNRSIIPGKLCLIHVIRLRKGYICLTEISVLLTRTMIKLKSTFK